ncbi:DUF3823 domain-containing protein [Danxiaibacter flavus]|uniref:DUF3823 domain-containing protein n=1 Tax=Danxiaibacter flavus TaxID=3049108 RepID=A0ABV3Z9B0_9BACT|nr:DUF3823 domain-containing protein [Chitinophagaceae bacterium DXS]
MKKVNIQLVIICMLASLCACTKQDNYSAPSATVMGSVIDATTGKPIQTEQPNGIKMRLLEEKYGANVSPLDYWIKADGTFDIANVFSGQYKVVPIEGAFFPADTAVVDIEGVKEVSFTVTPFLTLTTSATVSGTDVIVNYKLSRAKVADKILDCKSLLSAYPTVSYAINEMSVTHDLTLVPDETALSTSYADTLHNVGAGTYYVRAAARTNNANNKYNYSEVIEVKVQ